VPITASRYSQASVRSGPFGLWGSVWMNDRTANLFCVEHRLTLQKESAKWLWALTFFSRQSYG
jgi:hypothetical protein